MNSANAPNLISLIMGPAAFNHIKTWDITLWSSEYGRAIDRQQAGKLNAEATLIIAIKNTNN